MKKLMIPVLVVATVMASMFAGCAAPAPSPTPTPTPTDDVIRIGALVPITGEAVRYGPPPIMGATLALEQVNYEVAGKKIEYYYEDDNSYNSVQALDMARKLVEGQGCQFFLGPIASSSYLGTTTYLDVLKIPCFAEDFRGNFLEWDPEVMNWNFSTGGSYATTTYQLGLYAYDELGYRTATIIQFMDPTGYNGGGAFCEAFESRGGRIVNRQSAPSPTMDFGPYFLEMGEADCTAIFLFGEENETFMKQYYDFGLWDKQPLLTGEIDLILDSDLANLGDWTQGMIGSCDYNWTVDSDLNREFVAAFRAANNGTSPQVVAQHTYTSVNMLLECLRQTNGDTDPYKIREALLDLTIEAPTGTVTFDKSNGGTIKPVHIVKVDYVEGILTWDVIKTIPNCSNPGYYCADGPCPQPLHGD